MIAAYRPDHFNVMQRLYFKLAKRFLSPERFAELSLRRWFGEGRLATPRTFNEKLHWLNCYYRDPRYPGLADKYLCREYVTAKVGAQHLVPMYAMWEDTHQVSLRDLPQAFALKATHASGKGFLVRDKDRESWRAIEREARSWLSLNYYHADREWVYRDLRPRVIAEQLLIGAHGRLPWDYKVHCFNGRAEYIMVITDRFENRTKVIFDREWRLAPFMWGIGEMPTEALSASLFPRPERLDELLTVAESLAEGMPYVRIDCYLVPQVLVGEVTFFPLGGNIPIFPREWSYRLGDLLHLPAPTPA
ncbi:MAG: hypothetical protein RLZZ63_310 [Gemmatimonadota bacterium]